jgi:uncharacterized protein YegL
MILCNQCGNALGEGLNPCTPTQCGARLVVHEPPDQTPFVDAEFIVNPEPRLPCVLLLDTSSSMRGKPISELNKGLVAFKDELMADRNAVKTVEVAIVTFGPVKLAMDFHTPDAFHPPALEADGDTPMGEAIEFGISILQERKKKYRMNGIEPRRPWFFLITDGAPTDKWQQSATRVHHGEAKRSFLFYAAGVEGANMDVLRQISGKEPFKLKELRFRDLFVWLTASLGSASRLSPGDDPSTVVKPYRWLHE